MTIEADPIDLAPELEVDPIDASPDVLDTDLVETPDPKAPPKTMEDTIRDTFRKLQPGAKAEIDPASAKPVVERARDPLTGKFIETPEEKAAAVAAAAKPLIDPAAKVEAPKAPGDPRLEKAPTSWRGPAQAKWAAVDPEIRAEVLKREDDMHKGLQQYKGKADTFDVLDAEIRPYEALIRAAGTNPQTAIRDFFNTAYLLKTGTPESKLDTLLNIAQEYGVDLELLPQVMDKRTAGTPIVPPEVRQLEQQVAQLRGSLEQQQTQQKQQHEAAEREAYEEVVQEIAAFAAKNPHYEAVKLDMAALIESGRAKSPQDAYDKATWANSEVRALLLAEQHAATRKQAADKAAAARKASSTNVTTRGAPPSAKTAVVGTMDDTIRNKLREMTAGT